MHENDARSVSCRGERGAHTGKTAAGHQKIRFQKSGFIGHGSIKNAEGLRHAKAPLVKSFTKMAGVTLQDVARATGFAVSTVSYALRGARNVPPATAARIKAEAGRLGYRVNARVAELMSHVRRGRSADPADRLALVWVETGAERGLGREIAEGARTRAFERGYGLAEFALARTGGRTRRLADILVARGIAGVIFGPVFERTRVDIDWPWERFAMAVVGTAEWKVPLSRAAHHHYEAMRLALESVEKTGAKRPAVWLGATTNERAHRGWQAAWLAYGPADSAKRLWLTDENPARQTIRRWLREMEPDVVLVGDASQAQRVHEAGWTQETGRTFLLDWRADAGLPGVAQGYDTIAGHAVDLVVAQLQRNERGAPDPPRSLLFPGRWRTEI